MAKQSNIHIITDLCDEALTPYARLTEAGLRSSLGLFIAESPKVIHAALDCGLRPVSLLCEQKHIEGDAASVIDRCPEEMPIYTGERELLRQLTGYTLTRGVLCAMQRPKMPEVSEVLNGAKRVVVIDGVSDTTNIGSIFRSSAALGVDAVLVTSTTCDPLNRRAVRVSMGTVFRVPWTRLDSYSQLREEGIPTIALALSNRALDISDPVLKALPRLAMILGEEGYGLADKVIEEADYVAKIPMQLGVDSLNVGAAAALAIWQLRPRN